MQTSLSETSITVNGQSALTPAATLAELVERLGYEAASIATAVNGDFVPRTARASRRLTAGDAIEIVAPRQGG